MEIGMEERYRGRCKERISHKGLQEPWGVRDKGSNQGGGSGMPHKHKGVSTGGRGVAREGSSSTGTLEWTWKGGDTDIPHRQ